MKIPELFLIFITVLKTVFSWFFLIPWTLWHHYTPACIILHFFLSFIQSKNENWKQRQLRLCKAGESKAQGQNTYIIINKQLGHTLHMGQLKLDCRPQLVIMGGSLDTHNVSRGKWIISNLVEKLQTFIHLYLNPIKFTEKTYLKDLPLCKSGAEMKTLHRIHR